MKMDSRNYVENVLRTEAPVTDEMIERFSNPQTIRLLHGAIGITTEIGELMDALKKHLFYGKPLDLVNIHEEQGDMFWYNGLIVDVLQTTISEIMTGNINKLRLRYPEKFSQYDAENRNIAAERELLEKTF